jgi:hypothetical protein
MASLVGFEPTVFTLKGNIEVLRIVTRASADLAM